MRVVLKLLDDVPLAGTPVAGERPRAQRAALAAGNGRPVRTEELIELVWGDEISANATKSLEVLVSRTRSACGLEAIVRDVRVLTTSRAPLAIAADHVDLLGQPQPADAVALFTQRAVAAR